MSEICNGFGQCLLNHLESFCRWAKGFSFPYTDTTFRKHLIMRDWKNWMSHRCVRSSEVSTERLGTGQTPHVVAHNKDTKQASLQFISHSFLLALGGIFVLLNATTTTKGFGQRFFWNYFVGCIWADELQEFQGHKGKHQNIYLILNIYMHIYIYIYFHTFG